MTNRKDIDPKELVQRGLALIQIEMTRLERELVKEGGFLDSAESKTLNEHIRTCLQAARDRRMAGLSNEELAALSDEELNKLWEEAVRGDNK